MRVSISVPDDLFNPVERLVERSRRRRTEIYADALREYFYRHDPDQITATYSRLASELEESPEEREFRHAAARAVFKATEW